MKNELTKRRKRFCAFCLAFVLLLGNTMPMAVFAANYQYNELTADFSEVADGKVYYLNAGDVITIPSDYGVSVSYYGYDGGPFIKEYYISSGDTHTIKSYAELTDETDDSSEGEGWEVIDIGYESGGYRLVLARHDYTQSEINYVLNDGANAESNPSSYYEGKEEITLEDASKEGYTFEGWYTDANFAEDSKVTSIPVTQTGNVTLYAKFTGNTYNITYNLDGGSNAADNPENYTYGTGVVSFADASKEGYTFEGWYTDANFAEDSKVTSIPVTQTGNVTLYAKFTANTYNITYNITYNLNGGSNAADNPENYTYGTGVVSFADASKEGYTFEGWYTDANFAENSKVTSIPVTQTGNVTLYAKFTLNDDNNGKVAWDEISNKIKDATDGDKIIVDMNGETVLPKDILSEIKGRDIDLILDMGNGFIWTINGKTVTDPKDVDMGVSLGSGIPVKVINLLTGGLSYITITLAHEGDFGFTAILTVNMGSENNGEYANLYYYNEKSNATEFISSGLIGNDGNAKLTFTHASEYIILIDIYDHGAKMDEDTDDEDTDNEDTDNVNTDNVDTDNSGTDKADTDNVDTDNSGTDKAGTDNPDTGDNYADSKVIMTFVFAVAAFTVAYKKRKNKLA